jgi:hypothetical protein
MKLPQRHEDAKNHKGFIFNELALVRLCAFAPWWQKKYISEWIQLIKINFKSYIWPQIKTLNQILPYEKIVRIISNPYSQRWYQIKS